MSATTLSNIQELIERTVFENIRQELVDKGYLPDITTYPDTPAGEASYFTDLSSIKDNKGFAIELFNESSNYDKGTKKVPRIVINSGNFLPGDLGGDPMRYFEDVGNSYTAKVTPPQTSDFYLNVHLVSGSVIQERILNSILALAIPRRKYLKWYSDINKSFFIRNINFSELDDSGQGLVEKVFMYEIPDCWDTSDIEISTNIAKMSEITLHPLLQKYMDNSLEYPTDTLKIK